MLALLFLQTPLPGVAMGLMEIVVGFALAILIGLSGWQMRTLRTVESEIGTVKGNLASLKQLIVGYDGNNGIRSQVEELEEEMDIIRRRHSTEDELRARGLVVTPTYIGTERRVEARREDDPPPPAERAK